MIIDKYINMLLYLLFFQYFSLAEFQDTATANHVIFSMRGLVIRGRAIVIHLHAKAEETIGRILKKQSSQIYTYITCC